MELTSTRADGTWTWRAAGAREPRGTVEGGLLPDGSKVGDTVRVDADFDLDGITILQVLPSKIARKEPQRISVVGNGAEFQPVISTLAEKTARGRDDRRDRPPRRTDRPEGDRPRRPEGRADRPDSDRARPAAGDRARRPLGERGERAQGTARPERGERPDRTDRPPRTERPPRPAPEPAKPRPKRLRPGRTHRDAMLAELPEEERPIAEEVLRGGVPALRQKIEEQNLELRAEGKPEIKPEPLVALAENLLPKLRIAEWHDRAEAALAHAEEIDLRDLRSVVAAASDAARDDSTRDLAALLRTALNQRQDREFAEWLNEIGAALSDARVVRALRLSSRPPKAGVPFPVEVATRLADATSASLTADATTERWIAVLDALALAPVRSLVVPASLPVEPSSELLGAVARFGSQLPKLASIFGVVPLPPPKVSRGPRRPPKPTSKPAAKSPRTPPAAKTAVEEPPPAPETPAAETPPAALETPAEETQPAALETPAEETPPAGAEAPAEETQPAGAEAPVEETQPAAPEAPAEPLPPAEVLATPLPPDEPGVEYAEPPVIEAPVGEPQPEVELGGEG